MARRRRSVSTASMVTTPFATGENLKWDVRWVVRKGKEWYIVVHDFGDNLQGAIELYLRAKAPHRHYVTLRCKNSAFPPPKLLRPFWYKKRVKATVLRKRRGKTREVTITRLEDRYRRPLYKLNKTGQWWCPYCREMREFVYSHELPFVHPPMPALKGFGDARPSPKDDQLHCPMCLISTQNHHVRKWNPIAERF